jgi:radical SAM-linked protein
MYRLFYSKTGLIKFISHLDSVRTWQRAFHRAGLPVMMSKGFTPHPVMSFCPPLPVGVAGRREVLTFSLSLYTSPGEIKRLLESVLPEGLDVLEIEYMRHPEANPVDKFNYATYEADIGHSRLAESKQRVNEAISARNLELRRKDKKGRIKPIDIKPLIKDLRVGESETGVANLRFTVAIGKNGNLNCYDLLRAVLKWPDEQILKLKVTRISLSER